MSLTFTTTSHWGQTRSTRAHRTGPVPSTCRTQVARWGGRNSHPWGPSSSAPTLPSGHGDPGPWGRYVWLLQYEVVVDTARRSHRARRDGESQRGYFGVPDRPRRYRPRRIGPDLSDSGRPLGSVLWVQVPGSRGSGSQGWCLLHFFPSHHK